MNWKEGTAQPLLWVLMSTVLATLITTVESGKSGANCSVPALEFCLRKLQKVAQSDEMAFASTPEELHSVCKQLRDGVSCVEDYMSKCFTRAQRKLFNSVVAGSRTAIHDLCIDGNVQAEYLRHARCYKNVSTDVNRCAVYYQRVVQVAHEGNHHNNNTDMDEALRNYCCAFTYFLRCKFHFVARDCGPEATQFLHTHTERMSGPLIHQHCVLFTYDSAACTDTTDAAEHQASTNTPTIVLFFSLLLLHHVILRKWTIASHVL